MVLDGQSVIDKHLVHFPKDEQMFDEEAQIQPNGIDLRVISVSSVFGTARVPRDGKVDFSKMKVEELPWKDAYVSLKPGESYVVNFREEISVRDGYCAIIVPRSSLLRSGNFVTSALWDTGFQGTLGGVIRPLNQVEIEYGARLAQVQFHEAKFRGDRYEGRYQNTTSQTALMT